ncbi:hypothetical protein TWF718_005129 [Orbilia javanica]|uniref:Uncharacterized protein n=1 Tax=Orbilia javanica TaxID=47235 RepID=A0AAN8P0H0_9PEZI
MLRSRTISAARQLDAVQKLSSLEQEHEPYTGSIQLLDSYVDRAAQILRTLGPDYDEAVTLKMVRGLADNSIKQTLAMMMYDKEWTFEEVEKILRASVRGDIFDADYELEMARAPEGRASRLLTF